MVMLVMSFLILEVEEFRRVVSDLILILLHHLTCMLPVYVHVGGSVSDKVHNAETKRIQKSASKF